MPRKKKSRKVGLIGVRKDPNFKPSENSGPGRPKKHKGKPAGSRNNVESSADKRSGAKQTNSDPRHGSKKPVQLVKHSDKTPAATRRKYASPAEELAALEADDRLASLLEKLDNDEKLSREQQAYVNEKMERHRIVCDLLGIELDDVEEDEQEQDPLDSLDAISIDDFKR